MSSTTRSLGFTNSLQRLVWQSNSGSNLEIVAHLWGGGGGGGGSDRGTGGSGSGGGYSSAIFTVSNGDVIDIAVGGGGGAGRSGVSNGAGGVGGASYVEGGVSYSGGNGGRSGAAGTSGSGGGGGGATVLLLNGTVIGVAGGGGGGGGAGQSNGTSAPGSGGQTGLAPAGQSGQDKSGDGGGGGGGGGNGGNGGATRDDDSGADAGTFGYSDVDPSGRTPGGTPLGQAGVGGTTAAPGNAGAAQLVFNIPGMFVHDGDSFKAVQRQWIRTDTGWQQINEIYVNDGGTWNLLTGTLPAVFDTVSGSFGVDPRPY